LERLHQETNAGAAAQARDAYQATVALGSEMAALKIALSEQQRTHPDEALVRSVEEVLRGQIDELRDQIAQKHRAAVEWENQFKELRADIQVLMQRQVHPESVARQIEARVTQEAGQIRGGLKDDLVAIETQLKERNARDTALQGLEETLNLRLRELHNQSALGALALEQRDGELRDLKSQVRLLAQQLGQIGQAATLASMSRPDPVDSGLSEASLASVAPALQRPELRPTAAVDSVVSLFQPATAGGAQTPDRSKLSAMDLHDRLSAEIERKRAELREKSGRWKVRQS